MTPPFPYLLLPVVYSARNRARRREAGDTARALLFGGIALLVSVSLFTAVFWITWHLLDYEELGEYLLRLGLSWLFLTFLSFLTFSAVVTSLATFFLSEDLRLLFCTPVTGDRLFYSRFVKTAGQSSWMVVAFVIPVLLAVGSARCAGTVYYVTIVLTVVPFVLIPVSLGAVLTLALVNVFPARRARDILMFMGILFAVALVLLLRFIRPERLLSAETLPDVTAFFGTLQSPVTPLLPSFWAGEALFAALQGQTDGLHLRALWSTALALTILARISFKRGYFSGYSKAQEARKARFTRLLGLERSVGILPIHPVARTLLLKDLKVFLRDTTQWSQLLLLLALVVVYLYNFRVLGPDRLPYVGEFVKNLYAFVNLGLAAFVLSAVAVRFVFPAVSVEGPAFWLVKSAPITLRSFLWSKFWTGLVPVLVMVETLTILSNQFLKVDPFLRVLGPVAMSFMSFALVGLAAGLGARYPRFQAENVTQVAGSYGGILFMVQAVLFILVEIALLAWPSSVYLWHQYRRVAIPWGQEIVMGLCFLAAGVVCSLTFWIPMQRGIRALETIGD